MNASLFERAGLLQSERRRALYPGGIGFATGLAYASERGELFVVAPGEPKLGRSFDDRASREALEAAQSAVARRFVGLVPLHRLRTPKDAPRALAWTRDEPPEGSSWGLAFALRASSLALGASLPSAIASTGTIDASGAIGAVKFVAEKASAAALLLGPRLRLLVPAENHEEAVRAVDEAFDALRRWYAERARKQVDKDAAPLLASCRAADVVFAVRTLDEALAVVARLPGAEGFGALERVEDGAGQRRDRVDELVEAALAPFPPAPIGWGLIEAGLLRFAGDDPAGEIELALRVVRRHLGAAAAELPLRSPRYEGMRRHRAMLLRSHVVQSCLDGNFVELDEIVRREAGSLPSDPMGDEAGELRLCGALGRALTGLRRFDEARTLLLRACEGWRDQRDAGQLSFPLTAAIRLAGVSHDGALFNTLARWVDWARASDAGSPFLDLELVRSAVLLTRTPERVEAAGPDWLVASIRRWQARADDAAGRHAQADDRRAALRRDRPPAELALLQLDAALVRPISAAAVAALLRTPELRAAQATRFPLAAAEAALARGEVQAAVRIAADEYPY